jgi:hypothetical protein
MEKPGIFFPLKKDAEGKIVVIRPPCIRVMVAIAAAIVPPVAGKPRAGNLK